MPSFLCSCARPAPSPLAGWRPAGRWLLPLLLLLPPVCLTAASVSLPLAALTPVVMPEYNVKAAYLLRFTRYIEWPAGAFAAADSPIVIGVLGGNPFGPALTRAAQGATSQGRPVEVRLLNDLTEARACHLVFVSRGHEREEAAWFHELGQLPVVTVADSLEGLTRGAVLSLFVDDRAGSPRVVFGASLPAARAAGVQLSAAMLPSARHIIREPAVKKEPS